MEDKAIWVCPRFYTLGKIACPAQKIPEDILVEKVKMVLGEQQIDRNMIKERIKEIIVSAHNSLSFVLKNGSTVDVSWQNRSRKESWTPEMRQAARERAIAQRKEHEKNAEGNDH